MAFKKVALAICLTIAVTADPSQSIDPYPYYNSPISEKLIDPSYINPLRRQVALDPGPLVAVLALVSSPNAAKFKPIAYETSKL